MDLAGNDPLGGLGTFDLRIYLSMHAAVAQDIDWSTIKALISNFRMGKRPLSSKTRSGILKLYGDVDASYGT
jgi:hypothetical protein